MKDVRNVSAHIELHFQKITELFDISRKYVPKDEAINRQAIKIQDYQQNNLKMVSKFQMNVKQGSIDKLDRIENENANMTRVGYKKGSIKGIEGAGQPIKSDSFLGAHQAGRSGVFNAEKYSFIMDEYGIQEEKLADESKGKGDVSYNTGMRKKSNRNSDISMSDRRMSNMSRNLSRISLSAVDANNILYKGLVDKITKMKEADKIKVSIKDLVGRIQ